MAGLCCTEKKDFLGHLPTTTCPHLPGLCSRWPALPPWTSVLFILKTFSFQCHFLFFFKCFCQICLNKHSRDASHHADAHLWCLELSVGHDNILTFGSTLSRVKFFLIGFFLKTFLGSDPFSFMFNWFKPAIPLVVQASLNFI